MADAGCWLLIIGTICFGTTQNEECRPVLDKYWPGHREALERWQTRLRPYYEKVEPYIESAKPYTRAVVATLCILGVGIEAEGD
mmetsp:Transcript_43837/g.80059  ORF Transcript_43837/g.80059 Transcript_43837/m.80059 type:complete len:84 (+) Transcript_43837:79-330(+)